MNKILATAALALAAILFASADKAQAQGVYNGFIGGNCLGAAPGFGLLGSPYALGRVPTPPYFALHPPVYYYGPPVPRSYGYSPFAYPGSVRTPEIAATPAPQPVVNPHVDPAKLNRQKKATPLNLTKKVIEPQIISNPFVAQQLATK